MPLMKFDYAPDEKPGHASDYALLKVIVKITNFGIKKKVSQGWDREQRML